MLQDPDQLHPGHGLFYEFHRNQSGHHDNVLLHALGQWRITPAFHDVCFLPAIAVRQHRDYILSVGHGSLILSLPRPARLQLVHEARLWYLCPERREVGVVSLIFRFTCYQTYMLIASFPGSIPQLFSHCVASTCCV